MKIEAQIEVLIKKCDSAGKAGNQPASGAIVLVVLR